MSIPTATEVRAYAPEFSDTPDTRINLFVGFASDFVSSTQFGLKEKQALILVACHLMIMANRGSAAEVSSEKVGDLSVNYSVNTTGDEYDSTSYGKAFKALKRTIKRTPLVV